MNNERIMAIMRLVVPIIISIATYIGYDLGFDEVYTTVSTILALASFLWAWWKNNNITEAAQEAQKVLNELKAAKDENHD